MGGGDVTVAPVLFSREDSPVQSWLVCFVNFLFMYDGSRAPWLAKHLAPPLIVSLYMLCILSATQRSVQNCPLNKDTFSSLQAVPEVSARERELPLYRSISHAIVPIFMNTNLYSILFPSLSVEWLQHPPLCSVHSSGHSLYQHIRVSSLHWWSVTLKPVAMHGWVSVSTHCVIG